MSGLGSGGADDNDGQAAGPEDTFVAEAVPATLSVGSHPGSNAPGRRHEDDDNIVSYSLKASGGNQQDDHETMVYNPARTLQKDGSVTESFKPDTITDALHQPTGNKEPLVGGVRRLTPTECCRLQSFPDDWLGEPNQQPDSPRYAAMGDAVTVNVSRWIGERLIARV